MDTQVSPLTRLTQRAQAYFLDQLHVGLDSVLAPIDAALPAGRWLRGGTIYSAIETARRRDDDSLPRGAWDRDLKRADWEGVTAIALDALRHKSKDLQLAGWLLEAQIHQHGFHALAPCLLLVHLLCEHYWSTLHPLADDDDLEFRANILRWMADKLLPALRLLPLAVDGHGVHYCLADWETAARNEQVRAAQTRDGGEPLPGVAPEQLQAALHGATVDACLDLRATLDDALTALGLLMNGLDERLGADGPSFSKMAALLESINALLTSELQRRGADPLRYPASDRVTDEPPAPGAAAAVASAAVGAPDGAIRDRHDAYARLAEAAAFLCRVEPHSPAPYLVKRAIEWGRLNTTDLYQELFIRQGGTLSIFELLGLETNGQQGKS